MSLTIKQNLVSSTKYSIKCPYAMTPLYITVHNTANDASATNEITYMISNNDQVSYHFAVDDLGAIQGLPLNRNGWHCGDGGSGTGNRYSIGVEICYSKSGGTRFVEAEKNAAKLIAKLMVDHNISLANVKKHQDWDGKYCPHRTLDLGWTRFKNMVQAEYVILTSPSYKVLTDLKGYSTAADAKAGTNPKTTVAKGDYFVFKDADGMKNISKTRGVAGSWINPKLNVAPAYVVHTELKGYSTAADAKARVNAKTTVAKGDYFVFKDADGMKNISKINGSAGSWINPADNVAPNYQVVKDIAGYVTAADAKARINRKTTVVKGAYYVFKDADGMKNVSKTKGVAGSWINPADNK